MQKTVSFRFTLLTLTLLTIGLATANAQSRQRWSAGPRLGLNLSKLNGDYPDNKFLPGFAAGLGVMYSDISRFGFATDVLYSQRGAQKINGDGRQRINYIEVVSTARYFLNDEGNFRPNIYLGPSFNFMTGANFNRVDNKSVVRPIDIGITAGIQLNFRVQSRQRFLIDARYTQGVADVLLAPGTTRNQTVTIGLGYNFGIGRNYRPGDAKLPVNPRRR